MPTMIILNELSGSLLDQVRDAAPGWQIVNSSDPAVFKPQLAAAEIIVDWMGDVAADCLKPGTALRWIHSWGAGVNSMPLDRIKARNVWLTNSSGIHAYPISETILAMILAFARRLNLFIRYQQNSQWHSEADLDEIHERTIGIIGVGAIGTETARLARAFRMRVLGCRRSGAALPEIDRMYTLADLGEMLSQCDYVVNTLPLTPETRLIIGPAQFRQMQPNAFYVNIGRGGTTDTLALIEALQENRLAGAGLDVFDPEPLPPDSPLWNFPNVIITPHNSGASAYYDQRALAIFLANLQDYLAGRQPARNLVDLDLGY